MPPKYSHYYAVVRHFNTSIDGRFFSGVRVKSEITDYISEDNKNGPRPGRIRGESQLTFSTSKLNQFCKERLLFIGGNLIIGLWI